MAYFLGQQISELLGGADLMEPHCSGQWPVVWCSVFVITVCLCRDLGFGSVMSQTLSALLKKSTNVL